jgi:hypothetical protein
MSDNIHTDITLADVQLMQQIIDVCAKRGAFHPDEFVPIGALSNKLKEVVSKAKEEAEKEAQEQPQTEKVKTDD